MKAEREEKWCHTVITLSLYFFKNYFNAGTYLEQWIQGTHISGGEEKWTGLEGMRRSREVPLPSRLSSQVFLIISTDFMIEPYCNSSSKGSKLYTWSNSNFSSINLFRLSFNGHIVGFAHGGMGQNWVPDRNQNALISGSSIHGDQKRGEENWSSQFKNEGKEILQKLDVLSVLSFLYLFDSSTEPTRRRAFLRSRSEDALSVLYLITLNLRIFCRGQWHGIL